jgi:hypothetical protein
MTGLLQVAILIGVATVLADEWAHRDELAGRRFRELSPATVAGVIDQSRNRRWHRVGFRQRLELVALASGVVLARTESGLACALAFALMGSVVSLVFDISFNIRFGMPWWYAGTTAWMDEWLTKLGVGHHVNGGKVAAGVELALVVASAAAWLMLQ